MPPIPDGFAQVNFVYTGPQVLTGAEWTLGLSLISYGGSAGNACADIFTAYQGANLDAWTCLDCDLTTVKVKFGPDATGESAELAVTEGGAGGAGAPPNVTYLVQKQTAFGGRAGRGRLYMPGVTEGSIGSDGVLVGATVTAIQNSFDSLQTALEAADLFPVVLHGEGSPLSVPSGITSFAVSTLAATQRRRLRR